LRGYATALEAAGVPWAGVPVYECATLTLAEGARAAAWLLEQEPRPTALLAMSDQFALGALDAARALRLRVPDDVAVVGFDDIPAAARGAGAHHGTPAACREGSAGRPSPYRVHSRRQARPDSRGRCLTHGTGGARLHSTGASPVTGGERIPV